MPIRFRARYHFGTNYARRTRAIFDNEGLGQGVAQSLTNRADQDIGPATGGIRHHHTHGFRRPGDVLRLCNPRQRACCQGAEKRASFDIHLPSSSINPRARGTHNRHPFIKLSRDEGAGCFRRHAIRDGVA